MEDPAPPNDSILHRLKGKAGDAQAGLAEKLTAASEAGEGALRQRIAEINEILPLIAELGYAVDGIRIGVGLIPEVGLTISGLTRTMPDGTFHRVVEEQKDKPLLVSLIKALQTTSAMQHRVHILGMRADTASITLGFPPGITLEFRKDA